MYASVHTDIRQRKREQSGLDSYGVALSIDPVKTPEDALLEREEARCIAEGLETLPPRYERAMRMYYGIGCEPHTLTQVGDRFGITRERVRQIINNGERRLKFKLKRKLRPGFYRAEQELARHFTTRRREQERKAEWKAELEAERDRAKQAEAVLAHQRSEQIRYIKDQIRAMDNEGRTAMRNMIIETGNSWLMDIFNSVLIGGGGDA